MGEPNLIIKDETISITVVESEDGVHRAEISRNALGEYSIHQTRRVSDGRLRVQVTGWDEANTLDDMVLAATFEIQTQLEIDVAKPNRHMDSVAALDRSAVEMQQLATGAGEGSSSKGDDIIRVVLEVMAKAERAPDRSPPRPFLCGHPTKNGPCGNRVKGSGACAAGHPSKRS